MSTVPHNATVDLHLHSSRSDGRYEPGEVLERAAEGGLDMIALTDHDLCGALDPGQHQVGTRQVRVVAGAEISGSHDGREYHLLVYFPRSIPTGFQSFCEGRVKVRAQRYQTAVERLGLAGVPQASAEALRGERALTRHHLARALVDAGHASDVGDAFSRYAGHDNVPRIELPFVECIREVRAMGGLTSWAHPPRQALDRHLDTFVAAGLQGLEGLRPGMNGTDRKHIKKLAKRHGLYLTGGSDWHGWHTHMRLGLFKLRAQDLQGFLDALEAAA